MSRRRVYVGFLAIFMLLSVLWGQNEAIYRKDKPDSLLKSIREMVEKENAKKDSITESIQERYRKKKEAEEKAEKELISSLAGVNKPAGPEAFSKVWHNSPVPQHYSGMCWCFCTTSFIESELKRRHDLEIKLSELFTVYWEYVEKARRFIEMRGNSEFGQGSEANAVFYRMESYGAVPKEVYKGLKKYDLHVHNQLFRDMDNYLQYCEEENFWNEKVILSTIKSILNYYIGQPPEQFTYQGKEYTPQSFYRDFMQIRMSDYAGFMSTKSAPFYEQTEFDVPDNWWHDSTYYNIPLDEWYGIVRKSIKNGYSVVIGGDVSEPGKIGEEDVAFIPDFDINPESIDQDAREFRIYNHTTTDDHGIHIVGYTTNRSGLNKKDWYLIKDSGRSSRAGDFHGYYMFREDFIRLKMLTFMVHKDMARDILKKFKK